MTRPILQYPDFPTEFIPATNASNGGAGTILSQGEIGKDSPVAYKHGAQNTNVDALF
jgi:hypothetical protein